MGLSHNLTLQVLRMIIEGAEHLVIGGDPGKYNLLRLTNKRSDGSKEGSEVSYTSAQRRHESKWKWRQDMLLKRIPRMDRENLKEANEILSKENSRSPSLEGFKNYLKARSEVHERFVKVYGRAQWRINKLHNNRDRVASEQRWADRVKKTFSSSAIIAYGAATGFHALPGSAPTPTEGLRKRLRIAGLRVIRTPEAYSSKLCCRCHKELTKCYVVRYKVDRDGHMYRHTYSPRDLRYCQSCEDQLERFWNRDLNAAINIRNNLLYRLKSKDHSWNPIFSIKNHR